MCTQQLFQDLDRKMGRESCVCVCVTHVCFSPRFLGIRLPDDVPPGYYNVTVDVKRRGQFKPFESTFTVRYI
jgi:hypothetical protein